MMAEIWEWVVDYEGFYEVSNKGKVRSVQRKIRHVYGGDRNFPGKCLSPYYSNGYPKVDLQRDGKRRKLFVHRLVAEAFIPNPDRLEVVNHIDGNKSNSTSCNLEWMTYSENSIHAFEIGIKESLKGERSGRAILTDEDVIKIRRGDFGDKNQKEIGEVFGVSKQTIWGILNWRTWKHID